MEIFVGLIYFQVLVHVPASTGVLHYEAFALKRVRVQLQLITFPDERDPARYGLIP